MSLPTGLRLGPYEVLAPLGAGGMGEVYRARDTKLGREVALKILPDAFAWDPDRRARFEREAKTLAALNHPHIAQIHGFEQGEASAGAGPPMAALVLELVEGQTLAERIAEGPIPLEEALAVARQIAEALQAAHEAGIIHRDLKPANIKLRPDGTVKVLDFGLAKALDPAGHAGSGGEGFSPGGAAAANSPTLSLAATQAGLILGTAAYMAPEQARGKPADKRADVWAFGCVLYEMLTGKRPFAGEDVAETMAFVMAREPDWSALPPGVPASVRALLVRCLAKDRRRRLADLSAVLFVLDEQAALGAPAAAPLVGASEPPARAPALRALRVGALATVAALAGGGGVWLLARPGPAPVVRTAIVTSGPEALAIVSVDRNLAITPDGSAIVYRGNNQLLVRALDRLEPTVLTGVGNPRNPFVSPDGQWIGFFEGASALKKVAVTGGPPVTLTSIDAGPRGATWGADGTIVYATASASGLMRVSAAGGDPVLLTTPDRDRGEREHLWPEFLPNGRSILFTITSATGVVMEQNQIAVLDLETGAIKTLLRGGSHAQYVPAGYLIYAVQGTLRAAAFDLSRLEIVGTQVPVVDEVLTAATGAANVAIAANGTVAYVAGRGGAGLQRALVWVDRNGGEEPIPAPPRAYVYPRVSPDGTLVALDVRDQDNDIWIWNFARQTLTRFTFEPAEDQYPVWTPDGSRVLFRSGPTGVFNVFWGAADGTGAPEQLSESANQQYPYAVTADGTALVFREQMPDTRSDLRLFSLHPPRESRPLVATPFDEVNAELSPDGRWLAYQSNASGEFEVYVQPFPNVEAGRWQVSTAGGRTPLWARDGRELFYLAPDGTLMGVRVEAATAWRSTTPVEVLRTDRWVVTRAGPFGGRSYDIAPDGRRFLVVKEPATAQTSPEHVVVVLNWFEELKRLVPTR